MPECVSQRLACNAVYLVAEDRTEIPRRAFHVDLKGGGTAICCISRELLSESAYGQYKVAGLDRGRTQVLHGIPALRDRCHGLIDSTIEPQFGGTLREQIGNRLKAQQ